MITAKEYKETKDSFNLLGKIAKQLKLTGMSESFGSDDDPEIIGYLSDHPKAKEGYIYEVIIREVQIPDEEQYSHEAGGLGIKPWLREETVIVNEKYKPYRQVNNVEFTNKDKPIKI